MIEFKISDILKLKLENGIANIYVKDELFNQCKHIIIKRKVEELEDLSEIESVDELIDLSKERDTENNRAHFIKNNERSREITPAEEFWVHCSNLQIWKENNYNSLFLHRDLAFPLLKRLTETGDATAKKVFKEEIAKRLESGYHPVIEYLQSEGYAEYLDRDDLFSILLNHKEYETVLKLFNGKIEEIVWYYGFDYELTREYYDILIYNKSVVGLNFSDKNLKEIPKEIYKLPALRYLNLDDNKLKALPRIIVIFKDLKELRVGNNRLEEITYEISKLTHLEHLFLDRNNFKTIPESIGKLKSLKILLLYGNHIEELPESIGKLINLKDLSLESNCLKELPHSIKDLKSLIRLYLQFNKLYKLDEEILNLQNLEEIHLDERLKNQVVIKILKKKGVEITLY